MGGYTYKQLCRLWYSVLTERLVRALSPAAVNVSSTVPFPLCLTPSELIGISVERVSNH